MVITLVKLSAKNSYPAVCTSMAGGKETLLVLPLALVDTQISRDVNGKRIQKIEMNVYTRKHMT